VAVRLGLRGRLVATTVAAALAAVTVLVVALQLLLAHQSSRDSLTALEGRADAAATTVRFSGDRARVLEMPADSLDQNIWIYDAAGRRIDGTEPPRRVRAQVARLSSSGSERDVVVDGGIRLLARPVPREGSGQIGAVVVAALDLAPYESAERRGLVVSLGLGLITVVGAGAAAWAACGYALRQVRRMARRADEWREHDLAGRFELGAPRDELTELADTLDRMLDRIAQAILAERRLTDEVAHELRTPLTVIRSEAQLALVEAGPQGPSTASLDAIVAATDRMAASIRTMLSVARSAHADEATCGTAEVLGEVRAHVTDGLEVRVEVDDPGSDDVLLAAPLRVVGAAVVPLLDNAVRHAATRVRVHVTVEARRVLLHVEDDGDGVDGDRRDRIFEPGHSTAPDGAGLGLSLSRRLAHSIGGEVDERGDAHGHFVLSVPRA
jgi:two-component system, OmpR family, sensor kinase